MNYKVIVVGRHSGEELMQVDYFPNAKDLAVREAGQRNWSYRVDVVSTDTGVAVGRAYRAQPGTAVIWEDAK